MKFDRTKETLHNMANLFIQLLFVRYIGERVITNTISATSFSRQPFP